MSFKISNKNTVSIHRIHVLWNAFQQLCHQHRLALGLFHHFGSLALKSGEGSNETGGVWRVRSLPHRAYPNQVRSILRCSVQYRRVEGSRDIEFQIRRNWRCYHDEHGNATDAKAAAGNARRSTRKGEENAATDAKAAAGDARRDAKLL